MRPSIYRQPFSGDLESVLSGASHRENVLLLDGKLPWDGQSYSALLFDPRWILRIDANGQSRWSGTPPREALALAEDPLGGILELLPRPGGDPATDTSPNFCGIAGYFAYELGSARLGAAAPSDCPFVTDQAWLGAFDTALVFRRDPARRALEAEVVVASHPCFGPSSGPAPVDPASRLARALERLSEFEQASETRGAASVGRVEFLDPQWHRSAIQRIQEHLRAGNSYQVNLTGFASASSDVDPFRVYTAETNRNPVPFSAFLRTESTAISCHSPELLLRLRGPMAETSPIKGTIPIGPDAEEKLRASAKDRAEHVMIVDLCRNDLGRHAEFGSVRVEELAAPLHLRGIVHLMSRIRARLEDHARSRILADLFPAGSITGAPKRRTLDIIADVERHRRGPYTGSFGYVDVRGDADWNIAIRTAVWQDGRVHFGCGGGIVLDSNPDREYEEARWKAQSFFESLNQVANGAAATKSAREESKH